MGDEDGFLINGVQYGPEDLTFREQREMRKIIREQLADGPEQDIENMALADVVPAFVYVVLKRDNPDLTLDEILDMKLTDFVGDEGEPEEPKRPTKAAKAAASGTRS